MNRTLVILLSLTLFVLGACRKEKTSWDSNWNVPIAKGDLSLQDLLPPENVEENSDGYLSIVYRDTAFSFSLDTLVEFPDTTLTEWLDLVLFSFVTIKPDYQVTDIKQHDFDIGDIFFKRIIVKSGEAAVDIATPWPGKSKLVASFPSFYEVGGAPFKRTYEFEPGSLSSPSTASETANLTGLDMDLSGPNGLSVNLVEAQLRISSNEETAEYEVNNADSIQFLFEFKDIVPQYAKGYFGQHQLSDTVGLSFDPLKRIISGNFDLDSVNMTVSIMNGFKLIAQSKITQLSGINTRTGNQVDLNFPQLNTNINVNAASGNLSSHTAANYDIPIHTGNSNIDAFLENLPDSLQLGFELEVNPFGNVSGGNDEFFPSSSFDLFVDAEFPLSFSANDLTLVDTFDINYEPIESLVPETGIIELSYNNGFPLSAEVQFYLLDEQNEVLDSISASSGVQSGNYNAATYATSPTQGTVTYSFDQETIDRIEEAKRLMIMVSFSSEMGGNVKIDANAFFRFALRTNLQIRTVL